MKSTIVLVHLAALASAIVAPDQQLFAQIPFEAAPEKQSLWDKLPSLDEIADRLKKPFHHEPETETYPLDQAFAKAKYDSKRSKEHVFGAAPFDYQRWIEHGLEDESYPVSTPEEDDNTRSHAEFPPPPPSHGPPPPPHHGPPPPPHHGPPPPPPPHDGSPPPPPHHGPPHHGGPGGPDGPKHPPKGPHHRPGKKPGKKPGRKPKHPKKPGHRLPHHHHRHHKVNLTIYELISKSNFTKILAKYIDEDKELVSLLNSTKANHTLYAPADWAFKKLPKDFKPPKELIKKILQYHVSPGVYPTFKLVWAHTAPTLYEPKSLGGNPQRVLAKWLGPFRGLRLNYFSKVVAPNIITTNGIVHGISHFLLPPPPALAIISHLPGTFSTLELGLTKADLIDALNKTDSVGLTLFAPTNGAFRALGPRINAFLFSKFGAKFLKALLEYHIVPDKTLYSTAYSPAKGKDLTDPFDFSAAAAEPPVDEKPKYHCHKNSKRGLKDKAKNWYDRFVHRTEDDADESKLPFAHVHVDLPTLLKNHSLPVDIFRRGPFVNIRVNVLVPVIVADGLTSDGVIHVVPRVIIPPKKPGGKIVEEGADEMSLEEFIERLTPYVEKSERPPYMAGNEEDVLPENTKLEF